MLAPPFPAAVIAAARDALKTHLRIESSGEDAAIERVADTALSLGEAFTGTAWIAREWQSVMPAARGWQMLGAAPVTAITAVEGYPAEGAAFPLPADGYAIDINAIGEGWVRVTAAGAAGRVRVAFAAGAAAGWGDLPPPIAQGVVLLAAHLFETRAVGGSPPVVVAALWRPWRRMRLSDARRCA